MQSAGQMGIQFAYPSLPGPPHLQLMALTNVELDRLRKLYEGGVPNWYPTLTVRFRDNTGRLSRNPTPVATIHGVIDILVLLPGKRLPHNVSEVVQGA